VPTDLNPSTDITSLLSRHSHVLWMIANAIDHLLRRELTKANSMNSREERKSEKCSITLQMSFQSIFF
jgi:hypothetical protein